MSDKGLKQETPAIEDTPEITTGRRRPFHKMAFRFLIWFTGIWIGILLLIQVVLSPTVLTNILNKAAAEYIDGDISFGKASVSIFRHFPRITVNLEDFSITYPSDRFDSLETAGVQAPMLYSGTGEEADTLAYFNRFSASVSLAALMAGNVHLPHVNLDKPRIFAHIYSDGQTNWNLFGSMDTSDEIQNSTPAQASPTDTTEEGDMNIILGQVSLSGNPHIVYTDSRTELFAMIDLKQFSLEGKVDTRKIHKARINMAMDSLFMAGRLKKDTVALGLDELHIHDRQEDMYMHAKAKTFIATRAFGRMMVPIGISSSISFPEDSVFSVQIKDAKADVAAVPMSAEALIRMLPEGIFIDGNASIDKCRIQDVTSAYLVKFIPELHDLDTDAEININATAKGILGTETDEIPEIHASLHIPESYIFHTVIPGNLNIAADVIADISSEGKVKAEAENISVNTAGFRLNVKGSGHDLTGHDPLLTVDGKLEASLDTLQSFIPSGMDLTASGEISASVSGSARMSHLDIYNFSKADLSGNLSGKRLIVTSPTDSLSLNISKLGIDIGPDTGKSRSDDSLKERMLVLSGNIASADVSFKEAFAFQGKNVSFQARNSADITRQDTSRINQLGGSFRATMLQLKDSEGTSIKIDDTGNSFQMVPKPGQPKVPLLSLSSINKRITYITPVNRAILTDSEIHVNAAMNTIERRDRRNRALDSLSKVYPGIPRDSLFSHMRTQRATFAIPKWMTEDDFKQNDINIQLDESITKYFREWDINGQVKIRTGIVMTPYFPLRNILRGMECNINNNEIRIDSLKVMTGESSSEISAKGSLTGLRRALNGRGSLNLDLELSSDRVDADEIIAAANAGVRFKPDSTGASGEDISNADFLKQVKSDTTSVSGEGLSLIVLPSNLNADITVRAKDLTYSKLEISEFKTDLAMKKRCAQITNTAILTNMGNIYFNGFYASQTKEDIRTGFNLDMTDITAERVISMIPEVDNILPMLKSIKGLLNCEIAATADLNENMEIITPSMCGIVRLTGEDLTITEDKVFQTFARKLFFKNRKEGRIKELKIEGLLDDNKLEIFPFVLKLDRYTLALSGIQNLDMAFKHHVSLLRSPILIRLGVDLSGPDYDRMRFRIGRAKYRNTNVPVFSDVIDETKEELMESIYGIFDTGVEEALAKHRANSAITLHKEKIGYINAAEMKLEELSAADQKRMEEMEAVDNLIRSTMEACVKEFKVMMETNTQKDE